LPRTLATLQSYIDANHTITAHHETKDCSHYAALDLPRLAAKLGPDFNVIDRRQELLDSLTCSACGRKGDMSIIISPPRR
jgi:hypothetical protein